MDGAEYYNVYYAQRKLEGQLLSERGSRAQNMAAAGIVLKVLLPVSVAHRGIHQDLYAIMLVPDPSTAYLPRQISITRL